MVDENSGFEVIQDNEKKDRDLIANLAKLSLEVGDNGLVVLAGRNTREGFLNALNGLGSNVGSQQDIISSKRLGVDNIKNTKRALRIVLDSGLPFEDSLLRAGLENVSTVISARVGEVVDDYHNEYKTISDYAVKNYSRTAILKIIEDYKPSDADSLQGDFRSGDFSAIEFFTRLFKGLKTRGGVNIMPSAVFTNDSHLDILEPIIEGVMTEFNSNPGRNFDIDIDRSYKIRKTELYDGYYLESISIVYKEKVVVESKGVQGFRPSIVVDNDKK